MAKRNSSSAKKSNLIRSLLEKGMSSPSEVAARIKTEHGVEVDPGYVSVIKSQMKSRTKRVPRTAADTSAQDVQKQAMVFVLRSGGSIQSAKKALEDLRENPAMTFAISMGGVPAAIRAVERIESLLTQ